jgi:hypothetical protein
MIALHEKKITSSSLRYAISQSRLTPVGKKSDVRLSHTSGHVSYDNLLLAFLTVALICGVLSYETASCYRCTSTLKSRALRSGHSLPVFIYDLQRFGRGARILKYDPTLADSRLTVCVHGEYGITD